VITRNFLLGFTVLAAGLICGYFASRGAEQIHESLASHLPLSYEKEEIPHASVVNLSTIYSLSGKEFEEEQKQVSDAFREAARQKQSLLQSPDSLIADREAYDDRILKAERQLDVLRLKDYYSQFFLYYYHWLDSGDLQSAVKYKLALGQCKATLEYTSEKLIDDPAVSFTEYEEMMHLMRIADQGSRTVRWARVLLVFLLFLLLMGIPGFIRSSGYKRFAASLYFDALFRPHRISDLNHWHSVKRTALAFLAVYFLGIMIFFSFVSWKIPLLVGMLGLLPAGLLVLFSGQPGRWAEVLLSFLAPKMLILILILGIIAPRGTVYFWHLLWVSEPFRLIFISLLFMLLFRKFHVYMILARKWSHRRSPGSVSMLCLAVGIQLLIAGICFYIFGTEESLRALNRELLLVPDVLLKFPDLPLLWLMLFSGLLVTANLLILILNRNNTDLPSKSLKT